MSTALEQTSAQQYVDFDEYVEFQLRRTQSGIKWNDILTSLVGVGVVLTLYLLLFVLFDHWIISGGFSRGARLIMFSLVGIATTGWLVWRVVIPYLRKVNRLYAARAIEQAEPALKSTLLNLVDLRRAGRPVNGEIVTALEKRAAMALSKMDVDHAVDRRLLMRLSYILLASVVIACLYALLSPKQISFARAFLPTAEIAPATRTEILDVAPGDTEVLSRAHLEVQATLRGKKPDKVMLYYTTEDRRFVDEPVEMRLEDEQIQRYGGTITGENGRGILQPLTYRLEAADAITRDFIVTVQQPPSARVEEVRYTYPNYMELDSRTQQGGHIDGWEGTRVSLTAKTNMPVVSAIMQFFDDETETSQIKAEEVRLDIVDRTTLRAEWKLAFRSNGTYPRHYRIQVKTAEGDSDPEPVLYSYKIRPDLPPAIELLSPTADMEVPANAIIPLAVRVRDPDFKLRYVNLRVEKNGEELRPSPELFNGLQAEFETVWDWRLKSLGLKPGDVLTYSIEARDNEEPLGNYARAPQPGLTLKIIDEVSQKQAEQDHERRKEEIRQELDKDDPRANEKQRDPQQQQNGEGEAGENGAPDKMDGENGRNEGQPGDPKQQPQPGEKGQPNGNPNQGSPDRSGQNDASRSGQPQPNGQTGERPENQQGDRPPQKNEFSDDGSQDDDVLRELLKEQQKQQQQEQKQKQPSPDKQQPNPDQPNQENKNGQQKPGDLPQKGDSGQGQPQPEKGEQNESPNQQPGNSGAKPEQQPPKDQQGAGGESSNKPEGDSAGQDAGQSSGTPDTGKKDDMNSQPNSGGGEQKPASNPQSTGKEKPITNGEETPSDNPEGARPEKATGNEKGPATGGKDPDVDAAQAREKLERKEGEQGATRERPGEGSPPEGIEKKPGESPEKPSGSKTGEGGSPNPGEADPASKTKMGNQPEQNPDQTPSRPASNDSKKPAASQDLQQDVGNDDKQGEGRKQGQSSEQPQGGEDGSGKPNDQGAAGGNKSGAGDSSKKPGDAENSKKPSGGDSGSEKGDGSQKTEGASKPGGEGESRETQERNAQPGEQDGTSGEQDGAAGEQGDSNKPGKTGSGQSGKQPAGQLAPNGGNGSQSNADSGAQGSDSSSSTEAAEKANLDYNRQAADLALKRLEEQLERGEVDADLMKKLGWTEDQMKKFAERMRQQLDGANDVETPETAARRRQLEESLKSLNLRNPGQTRRGTNERDQPLENIAPRQTRVPAEYREAYEAYTRSLSRKGVAAPPPTKE